MATADTTFFDSLRTPPWPVRRFSVDEYRQLGDCGVLTPEDRVELLEGWIVPKMNHRPAHRYAVGVLNEWLQRHLPEDYIGHCQLPITTAKSEPEPDLTVVKGDHEDFRDRHPSGSDCRLVIEVADTSVERDRLKATIYASAGVEEYWILNLLEGQVERFLQPGVNGYQALSVLRRGDFLELVLGETVVQLELIKLLD